LGLAACQKLNVVGSVAQVQLTNKEVVEEFPDVFTRFRLDFHCSLVLFLPEKRRLDA